MSGPVNNKHFLDDPNAYATSPPDAKRARRETDAKADNDNAAILARFQEQMKAINDTAALMLQNQTILNQWISSVQMTPLAAQQLAFALQATAAAAAGILPPLQVPFAPPPMPSPPPPLVTPSPASMGSAAPSPPPMAPLPPQAAPDTDVVMADAAPGGLTLDFSAAGLDEDVAALLRSKHEPDVKAASASAANAAVAVPQLVPDLQGVEAYAKATDAIHTIPDFAGRISALQKVMGKIAIPEKGAHLVVTVSASPYFSGAFDESCFLKPGAQAPDYFLISVKEVTPKGETEVIRIRASEDNGELVWISKGAVLAGLSGEIGRLYRVLERLLNVYMYLYDDAKMHLNVSEEFLEAIQAEQPHIWLKASHAIGSVDGRTPYERDFGFTPIDCEWKRGNTEEGEKVRDELKAKNRVISQSLVSYREAVNELRKTKLSDVFPYYKKMGDESVGRFQEVVKRTLKEPNDLSACAYSFHDLEREMVSRVKSAVTPEARRAAEEDQLFIHTWIYYPWKAQKGASKLEKEHWKRITTIAYTFVFVKKKVGK